MLCTCARYFFCVDVSFALRVTGDVGSSYLDDGVFDEFQHVTSILDCVFPLLFRHDARPELCGLCVVALLAFVPIVALAAHDVVRHLVWCFSNVWPELVCEAVRRVLLVPCVIGVDTHCSIEV